MKTTIIPAMTPEKFKIWLAINGYDISGYCRMMKIPRRTLQRRLAKRSFIPAHSFLLALACHTMSYGVIVEGMGSQNKR